MGRIIVELLTSHKTHLSFETFDKDEITIGRGFQNDIILSDQHIASDHLCVRLDEKGLIIKDLGSVNGTYISRRSGKVIEVNIESGTEIRIGRTRLRLYRDSHVITPEFSLQADSAFLKFLKSPFTAWFLSFIFVASLFVTGYVETTTKEEVAKLFFFPIVGSLVLLSWMGFWALIGLVVRRKASFAAHVSIFCLWCIIGTIVQSVNAYIGYYSNNLIIYAFLEWVSGGVFFIILLYLSLTFATYMKNRTRIVFPSILGVIIMSSAIGIQLSMPSYQSAGSPFNTLLKAPIFGVPDGVSTRVFSDDSKELFLFDN